MSKKKSRHWYPVTTFGMAFTVLYALVPIYVVYAQATDHFPEVLRLPLVSAMGLILVCMVFCLYTNQKPFHKKGSK